MKQLIQRAASNFGYEIRRIPQTNWFEPLDLFNHLRDGHDGEIENFLRYAAAHYQRSQAQLFQDLFVLSTIGEKRGGFFVEFGAADGKFLSNTYLLEKQFAWRGIVAEPSKGWHDELSKTRTCNIDRRCVWTTSGEMLPFSESPSNDISTISAFRDSDSLDRRNSIEYAVKTVSLNDLLATYDAPRDIDYMSIDTEGSELTILKSLDFASWRPRIITVEHNYNSVAREGLYGVLSAQGYRRVFANLSRWDDWYVLDATRSTR